MNLINLTEKRVKARFTTTSSDEPTSPLFSLQLPARPFLHLARTKTAIPSGMNMPMPPPTTDATMLETKFRMFAATLLAPAAAPISVVGTFAFREGAPFMGLFAPLALVTLPGIYGYALAFFPALLLGSALTLLSLRFPEGRPKRIWLAAGAFFGMLIGLPFGGHGWNMPVFGAIAGSACALTYRLIVGPALRRRLGGELATGMEPR